MVGADPARRPRGFSDTAASRRAGCGQRLRGTTTHGNRLPRLRGRGLLRCDRRPCFCDRVTGHAIQGRPSRRTVMLRPQDTLTRERKPLTGLWRFRLDGAGEGRSGEWFKRPLADAREMAVPASFNDIVADAAVRDHVGDVWYQATVRVPRGWDGQRIVLHFESATHRATVWVNGAEVVSHEGGYTPFEAEVTEHVQAGEEARVRSEEHTSELQSRQYLVCRLL